MNVAITGIGAAIPEERIDNPTLIERYGLTVTPEWIERNTGIRSRHWLAEGQTTSDLAAEAALAALRDAGLAPTDIDRLVLATVSPDMPTPPTSTRVLRKIGARCAAYDLAATCTGFLYALDAGAGALRNGARRVLVVCAEARSRFIDKTDHRASVLFSDGAAAVVLERSEEPGVIGVHLLAEGMEMLGAYVPAGGAALPTSPDTLAERLHHLRVDGRREIFDHFLRLVEESVEGVLATSGVSLDQVDLLVPHQGNARLTEAIAHRLGVPWERTLDRIAEHGNVSGASIPLALHDAVRDGTVRPGQLLLLTAVGAGATAGAALVRWTR
ncbi:MAG: ketoacyl-ACP synthase III [Alphaproteobacteria bacterium]|nr:ketoacyl-ACP synthase III [Alphaproteobacteria bacterium]MCB9696237.1 ketoacyl-ACP synthase III [Alphaproteobacteria bacterium]